jgi:hypothetical protein
MRTQLRPSIGLWILSGLTSGEAKAGHATMRWTIIILSVAGVAICWEVWSRIDAQHQQARLQQAAVCNGIVTADQLEDSVKAAVRQSHISIAEARQDVESLACPGMGG